LGELNGFAQKVLYARKISRATAQRRNGAKRYRVSQGFRCAVAPLRVKNFFA